MAETSIAAAIYRAVYIPLPILIVSPLILKRARPKIRFFIRNTLSLIVEILVCSIIMKIFYLVAYILQTQKYQTLQF